MKQNALNDVTATKQNTTSQSESAAKVMKIGNKRYILKSVFLGGSDVKAVILKLAEKKAIREMGLDITAKN